MPAKLESQNAPLANVEGSTPRMSAGVCALLTTVCSDVRVTVVDRSWNGELAGSEPAEPRVNTCALPGPSVALASSVARWEAPSAAANTTMPMEVDAAMITITARGRPEARRRAASHAGTGHPLPARRSSRLLNARPESTPAPPTSSSTGKSSTRLSMCTCPLASAAADEPRLANS